MKRSLPAAAGCLLLLTAIAGLGQKPKPKTSKPVSQPTTIAAAKPAVLGATGTACAGAALSPADAELLLKAHNDARAEYKLDALVWNCTLAGVAQEWADKGSFAHSPTSFGENVFGSSRPNEALASVVRQWMGEKVNYDSATGECIPGKVCTHFTQVLWRKTAAVGCGINRKASSPFKTIVVCNYSPAGNTGGRPY